MKITVTSYTFQVDNDKADKEYLTPYPIADISCHGIYMHGELAQEIGFDLVKLLKVIPVNEMPPTIKIDDSNYINLPTGVYEVEVIGIRRKCLLFLWKNRSLSWGNPMEGLIVLNDDWHAIEGAKLCQEKQRICVI